ncbi:unnamed protein product [Heligmosomoides polygyrus]|uniref:Transposase n=1 Tax=Heligmosomoides polygyrus TaxID=6339 RepID=A0A183GX20_HELPZ|nr:unnamed protein product [Heligmosomoides polygyrus]
MRTVAEEQPEGQQYCAAQTDEVNGRSGENVCGIWHTYESLQQLSESLRLAIAAAVLVRERRAWRGWRLARCGIPERLPRERIGGMPDAYDEGTEVVNGLMPTKHAPGPRC